MSIESFVSEFIDNCIAKGSATPAAMCQEAQNEIDSLEEKLKEFHAIKLRQSNLKQIIAQFKFNEQGQNSKPRRKVPMTLDLSNQEVGAQLQEICLNICSLIEDKYPEKLTTYQIRDAVVSLEDHQMAYAAIKHLRDINVIERLEDGPTVLITKGPNWDQRPTSI